MAELMNVEVVAADRRVWEGTATLVIVRTTEGDVGILPRHEPLLAALVPCAAEIVSTDGRREIIALEGGFLSVAQNRVSLLSQYATVADDISVERARRELSHLQTLHTDGKATEDEVHRMHLFEAQLVAAEKVQALESK